MKRHGVITAFPHSHLGEEKQEMLCLNRRLENYLNRVKLLEEENAMLAKEIRSLRHNDQRALTRRKGLEEELQQARMEVDAAWRDRVHTELEVGRLTDELHALHLHGQREAQAHMKAQTMLERSRKDLEEEQRAQIWLREKSSQLELELRLLIQNHQEDVAHLEATLTRSRSTVMPTSAQRGSQTPTLLQVGQEFSQKATRAWQEAAEAYQGQLAQLEESLNRARIRLSQVNQEKSESHMKLQSLQKEMSSAQDIRLHLEKTAAQQGARHGQETQELQEHVEELEVEKEELAQQINHILLQNQGLLQLKMSLGLEVATYRALLDSDVSMLNQPRTFSKPDAVLCSRTSHRVTSRPSVNGVTVITANPVSMSKPRSLTETPKVSKKTADATQSLLLETTYPKIVADGAVENFRPQEVCETVTHAEPLSPPDVPQALTTSADEEDEEDRTGAEAEAPESFVDSHQVECVFSSVFTASEPRGSSVEAEKEEAQEESQAAVDVWEENSSTGDEVELVQEETSDPGFEAAFASRTDGPASECESEQSVLNQPTDDDGVQSREISSHIGTNEDKLYPDGEEMDTWDSVIERKADVKTDDGKTEDGEKRQHAEPEDDISAKEAEQEQREAGKNPAEDAHEDPPLSDKEDDDSQNVSVSWRTEVESDNTLADTRPLIQYRNEETPHGETSELSEGDREKQDGDAGTWSEGRFGTMEDLCEEAEGDELDEEYDLGYTHAEDTDDGHNQTTREDETQDHQKQNQDKNENEGKCAEMGGPTDVDHEEELDTDRLVEEELDKLCTDSYTSHFASWQQRQKEKVEEAEVSSSEHYAPQENLLAAPHTQALADAAEHRHEEDEDGVSVATRADEREEAFSDPRPEVDDVNNLQEDAAADLSSESQEHAAEEAADPRSVPEWESLSEAGIRDEAAQGHQGEVVPEPDQDQGSDEGVIEEGVMEEGVKEESDTEEGVTDQGVMEESVTDEGVVEEGVMEEGVKDQGVVDEGLTDQGVMEEGVIEEGVTDEGVMEEGVIEEGVMEEGVKDQGVVEEGVKDQGVVEEGVMEEGVKDQGVVDEGLTDQGVTDQGVVEEGVMEEGVMEEGVKDQGVVEEGVKDQGVVEEGVMEEGVMEEGVKDQGVVEEGVKDQGVVEEGVKDQGVMEEGVKDQGVVDEGLTDQGVMEEGVTDQGVTDEGVMEEGVTDQGVTDEGVVEEGVMEEGVKDQGVVDEGLTDQGVMEEGVTDQGVTDEGVTDQGVMDEGVTDQGVMEEGVMEEGVMEEGVKDQSVVEPAQVSPHGVPDEDQIFVLGKRCKNDDVHDVLSCGFSDELWACPVETRASCQSEDVCSEAAEPKNWNQSFTELNGNSLGRESGEAAGPEHGEEEQPAHSEESEPEGESWSSGEEPI